MEENKSPFYAKGTAVFRRPVQRGNAISMGFKLCEVMPDFDETTAKTIADALNHWEEITA